MYKLVVLNKIKNRLRLVSVYMVESLIAECNLCIKIKNEESIFLGILSDELFK